MKTYYGILLLCLMVAAATSIFAKPKNVIIIRHADRVIPNGACLSLQGLERAAALAYYLTETSYYNTPPITHIFAAYSEHYTRCKQTCQPIADYLELPIKTLFDQYEVTEVAEEILTNPTYDNTTVLTCWEHKHIGPLIVALGGEEPDIWPENIFDQVYMLSFQQKGKPKFKKFLQQLLFGDRSNFKDEPRPLPQIPVSCPIIAP